MKKLLPLTLLLNAALSHAAAFNGKLPVSIPSFTVVPMRLPSLPVLPLTGTRLPNVSLPAAQGGIELPGAPNPLPMQLPHELIVPERAVEAAHGHDQVFMRWDLLKGDDDGLAGALVPVTPNPKGFPPSGAMAELPTAVSADRALETAELVFDGKFASPLLAR